MPNKFAKGEFVIIGVFKMNKSLRVCNYWSFQNEQIAQGSEDFNEYTISQEDIDSFVKAQKSENIVKKTNSDMNNSYRYLAQINKRHINILNLQANELDHLLLKFFKDVRKINGQEYEPDTISGFQRSIQRFLSDGPSRYNILIDRQFLLRKARIW